MAAAQKNTNVDLKGIGERFSDLKKLIIECFGTPWWISDISAMPDKVRDRTLLVKIHSQMHPINDLVIYHVFDEIGVVEDVRYMPTESGFHSLVRFRNKDGHDWAYHYYNGRFLHQGCCELEIHRLNDVISWNAQRINEIKVAYGIDDSPVVKVDASLLGEKLKNDEVINREEELSQILIKGELNVEKEASCLVVHQMLNEIPKNYVMKDDELLIEEKLEIGAAEISDEEIVQMELKDELILMKEFSDLVAHQVFDEMPDSQNCHEHKLLVEFPVGIDAINQDVFEPKGPTLIMVRLYDNLKVDASLNEEQNNLMVFEEVCFDPGGKNNVQVENPDELKIWSTASQVMPLENGIQVEEKYLTGEKGFRLGGSSISNENELIDGELDHRAILVGLAEEQDYLKGFEDKMNSRLQKLVKSEFTGLFKLPHMLTAQGKTTNDYVRVLCFDPGEEEMWFGAASFNSQYIGVKSSDRTDLAVASSLPSLLVTSRCDNNFASLFYRVDVCSQFRELVVNQVHADDVMQYDMVPSVVKLLGKFSYVKIWALANFALKITKKVQDKIDGYIEGFVFLSWMGYYRCFP